MEDTLWGPVHCQSSIWSLLYWTDLLRVLRYHKDELEIVHSQCDIIQLVDVREEDDVLDSILDDLCMVGCSSQQRFFRLLTVLSVTDLVAEARVEVQTRSRAAACRHGWSRSSQCT